MGFKDDLVLGRIGEMVFLDYFTRLEDVKSVVDVRDDKLFQSFDVDFLLELKNRQFKWIEVKTDFKTYETGNIAYEQYSSGNSGCLNHTKAQIVAYYVPQSGIIYFLDVEKMRKFVSDTKPKLIKFSLSAEGFLLPLAELERSGVVLRQYQADRIISFDKT